MCVNKKMTAIADAIREKTNGTTPLTLDDMAASIPEVYNKGFVDGQAQGSGDNYYDTFWDAFQQNGKRTNYEYAFRSWDSAIINPKYKMKPSYASYMFFGVKSENSDFVKDVDFSTCEEVNYLFATSSFKNLPILDFTYCSKANNAFQHCYELVTIEKVIVGLFALFNTNSFGLCRKLTEIRFEGVISGDINFSWSPLSVESMKDIIEHLEPDGWYTLTFSSSCWEALEASGAAPDGGTWKSYVQNLGWSV